MLFGTINDFSSYSDHSNYNIKGKCTCLICEFDTYTMQLDNKNKNVFLGHHRFLNSKHHYHKRKKYLIVN